MFELFRQIFRIFYSAQMGFVVMMVAVVLPAVAIGNFVLVLFTGSIDEAGPAFVFAVASCGIIAFVVWVHRDATSTGERLERRSRREVRVEQADEEDSDGDDENDNIVTPPTDQIRPKPGNQ